MCAGNQEVPPPSPLPPAGSGPVVYTVVVCFPSQGNVSLVDPPTYLYYMQSPDLVSLPSQNVWKPYNEAAEQTIVGDHKRLWATNFLDDLKIEAVDFPFSNGVIVGAPDASRWARTVQLPDDGTARLAKGPITTVSVPAARTSTFVSVCPANDEMSCIVPGWKLGMTTAPSTTTSTVAPGMPCRRVTDASVWAWAEAGAASAAAAAVSACASGQWSKPGPAMPRLLARRLRRGPLC